MELIALHQDDINDHREQLAMLQAQQINHNKLDYIQLDIDVTRFIHTFSGPISKKEGDE